MKIKLSNTGHIRVPYKLKGTYLQHSVRDVLKTALAKRGEKVSPYSHNSMSGELKLKYFPGAFKFERVAGQDTPWKDLTYETKHGNAEFCRAGLKEAFGKLPRRFYIKLD